MTHHAPFARLPRLFAAALAAPLVLLCLLACGGDDDDPPADEVITSAMRVVVTAAGAVRGVQLDMAHGQALMVSDVTPGTGFAGATCQENLETQRTRLACASSSDIVTPFTAWTLAVQHSTSIDPFDAVTAVTCTASGPTGSPVAATCTLE